MGVKREKEHSDSSVEHNKVLTSAALSASYNMIFQVSTIGG